MTWNPSQYLKFSDQRLRPALELLERVPLETPSLVYDLGCGTGHVTRHMAERWPAARVIGLDSSADMLEKARAEPGAVEWIEAAVETWQPPEAPDLIYSNATLHWVDDHRTLVPRLARLLRDGGCLAIQMPLSWDLPSHRLMRELAPSASRRWVEDAAVYYELLAGIATGVDIWETEYLQVLEGDDAVLEWVRGTGLRPVLDGLAEADRDAFLDAYRHRLREIYPPRGDGRTLYPFRRLFIVAMV